MDRSVLVREIGIQANPEAIAETLRAAGGLALLRTACFEAPGNRYSLITADPFLRFRSYGSRCELQPAHGVRVQQFGNPWRILDELLARYELLESIDLPFPLGACIGYWGYGLRNFTEPSLTKNAARDLDLPDCHLGFYDRLVVLDHELDRTWLVSTGLTIDGSRSRERAQARMNEWVKRMEAGVNARNAPGNAAAPAEAGPPCPVHSSMPRSSFLERVQAIQSRIQCGEIYQANLSHRLVAPFGSTPLGFFQRLLSFSPVSHAAFLECDDHQIISASPELFLHMSGSQVRTRPIKGTRPRSSDPVRDAQLAFELQTSPKEIAELVMITDLLRNDLGRICEYGSIQVPELLRLERYAHVQHLVSTVEGRLRPEVTHLGALCRAFPGGSITGAPKIRAMQVIDQLETVARGPYTGSAGYLGFNRESQLSILIRTAVAFEGKIFFHAGAGIVADSSPEAEYEETLAKATGFLLAVGADDQKDVLERLADTKKSKETTKFVVHPSRDRGSLEI